MGLNAKTFKINKKRGGDWFGTENPCVGGSTPPGGTIYFSFLNLT